MLEAHLKAYRQRLILRRLIAGAVLGARFGALAALVLGLAVWLAWLPPAPLLGAYWPLALLLMGVLAGAALSAARPLPIHRVAMAVEEAGGLGACLRTALELEGSGHRFAPAIQARGADALARVEPARLFPLRRPAGLGLVMLTAAAAIIVLALPAPLRERDPFDDPAQASAARLKAVEGAASELRSAADSSPELRSVARDAQSLSRDLSSEVIPLKEALDRLGRLEESIAQTQARRRDRGELERLLAEGARIDSAGEGAREALSEALDEIEAAGERFPRLAEDARELRRRLDSGARSEDVRQALQSRGESFAEDRSKLSEAESAALEKLSEEAIKLRQELLASAGPEKADAEAAPSDEAGKPAQGEPEAGASQDPKETGGKAGQEGRDASAAKTGEEPAVKASEKTEGAEGAAETGEQPQSETGEAGSEARPSESEAASGEQAGAGETEEGPKPKEAGAEKGEAEPQGPERPESSQAEPAPNDSKKAEEPKPEPGAESQPDGTQEGEPERPEDKPEEKAQESQPEEEGSEGGLLQEMIGDMAKSMLEMDLTPPEDMMDPNADGMLQDFAREMAEKLIDSGFKPPDDLKLPEDMEIPESVEKAIKEGQKEPSEEVKAWQKRMMEKLIKNGFKPPENADKLARKLADKAEGSRGEGAAKEKAPGEWQKQLAERLAQAGVKPPVTGEGRGSARSGAKSARSGSAGENITGPGAKRFAEEATGPAGREGAGSAPGSGVGRAAGPRGESRAAPRGNAQAGLLREASGGGAGTGRPQGGARRNGAFERVYNPKLVRQKTGRGPARWVIAGEGGSRVPAASGEASSSAASGADAEAVRRRRLPASYRAMIKRYFNSAKKERAAEAGDKR